MSYGVFIGLSGLDIVYLQNSLPVENQKSKTNQYNNFVGGPATNAAITYSLLGGQATLISCIGDSELGKFIKKSLSEDYNINVIDCIKGQDILPCISSISINEDNGSRTIWSGQQLFKVHIYPEIIDIIKNSSFCLFDCNVPEISKELIIKANELSKIIVLDKGSWKPDSNLFLSMASEVIASSSCIPTSDYININNAVIYHGINRFAITNGEQPIYWFDNNKEGEILPPKVNVKDTLGAGDIFHGAYCYYRFHESLEFTESLGKSANISARSVEYFGPREGIKTYGG